MLSCVPNVYGISRQVGLVVREIIVGNQNDWLLFCLVEYLSANGVRNIPEHGCIDADCAAEHSHIAEEVVFGEEYGPLGPRNVNRRMLLQF